MPDIILASASPQRKWLLRRIFQKFEILPSEFDESTVVRWPPEEHVMASASGKAKDIACKIRDGIVIGADTIIVLGSEIMGKPADEEDAVRMMGLLSGMTHYVFTGICLIDVKGGCRRSKLIDFEKTAVVFRRLSDETIHAYLETGESVGRAGAYAIQEQGCGLVDYIEGDYDNVVGLPVEKLRRMLIEITGDEL